MTRTLLTTLALAATLTACTHEAKPDEGACKTAIIDSYTRFEGDTYALTVWPDECRGFDGPTLDRIAAEAAAEVME